MSHLTPTLRLDITQQQADEMQEIEGLSVGQNTENLRNLFNNLSIKDKPFFTANIITDIETEQVLHNFEAIVVGKFTMNDKLHLKLSTGDLVAIEFHII